jgi:uncharacterized protein (DUF2141 family)
MALNVPTLRAALASLPAFLWAGCAHMEPPSGGPVDTTPPAVAAVYPAPGSLNVRADAPVVFQFTEWIDRNAARTQAFVSPPLRGKLRVEVDGDKLQVLPSEAAGGFRPNTAYKVTVLPTLKDLHGVSMGRAFSLRFSTGAALDSGALSGAIVGSGGAGTRMAALYHAGDRSRAEVASTRDAGPRPGALPEPWRELPAHLAAADSSGAFDFDAVAQGEYALLAFEDVNGNFAFDLGFEPAAVGALSLGLRPRPAGEILLRVVPADTVPLSVKTLAFVADAAPDSAGRVSGRITLEFVRPAQPALAAMAARYRVFSDSGESLPVLAAGWDPVASAWVLETAPLRAGGLYRLETNGRPDFPGRADAARKDTSFAFEAAGAVDSADLRLSFVAPAASTGLTQATSLLAPAAEYRVAASRALSPARLDMLRRRLEARIDTLPQPFQLNKIDAVTLSLNFGRPLPAGKSLALRLRPEPPDSAAKELVRATIADTSDFGGIRFAPPAKWKDWTFWLKAPDASAAEIPLAPSAAGVSNRNVPPGRYALFAFRDEDGDGVWNRGALRPWKAQEPYVQALDTVTVEAGRTVDVTGRFVPSILKP